MYGGTLHLYLEMLTYKEHKILLRKFRAVLDEPFRLYIFLNQRTFP